MPNTILKIASVILLFFGESAAIYAEVVAARMYNLASFWYVFLNMMILMTLAGGALIAGYMLGFKGFKDIWVVSVVSITSIIIMEPIINYTILHQLPTRGTLIGFILGLLGLAATILF